MRSILIRVLAGVVTFAVGVGCTFALTRRLSRWIGLFVDDEFRSCQVKRVGADGHVVWTPCEMPRESHREAVGRTVPPFLRKK